MRKIIETPKFVYLVSILLIILACNLPMITNTGGTAVITATGFATAEQNTNTSIPATPSLTSTVTLPSFTETITSTSTAVPFTPTNTTPPAACNQAQFVSDVNYPDGTNVIINANFTKTWRLQNTGTCDWTSGYKLIFYSGDRMSAPDETIITNGIIPSGAVADISVELKAPDTVGLYRGYFKLKSADNIVFGIGNSGVDAFWVEINADKLKIFKPAFPIIPLPSNTPTPFFKIKPEFKMTLKFP